MEVKEEKAGCQVCGETLEEGRRTSRCIICFKQFCENCAFKASGRDFCSRFCGEYFFFGGDDEV